MSLIHSPSGKAKCGEVGGKADVTPTMAGRKGIKYSRRLCRCFSIALPPEHASSSSFCLRRVIASINQSYRGDPIGLISPWLLNGSGSKPSLLVEAKSQTHMGFHRPIQGRRHPSMMRQEGTTAFVPSRMPTILPLLLLLAPLQRLTVRVVMGSLRISTSKCNRLRRRCLPQPEIAVIRPTCTAPYQALHAKLLRARLAGRTKSVITSNCRVLCSANGDLDQM